ncbi:MAG TPA: hypothetical protein VG367_19495 [Mucilaginibacter sp.]|jgi:hypothetical protein|nr:hypothetical protein [Mucilaginibacter sp.]
MASNKELDNNLNDFIVSVLKGASGLVPFAGSFIGEVMGIIIPNQRIDRVAKYVQKLEEQLSEVSPERLREFITKDEFIDLLEEGFLQATRATSDQRREYIACIIKNGLDEAMIAYQDSKHLLGILSELNDIELLWLRRYWFPFANGDEEFLKANKDVLNTILLTTSATDEERRKHMLQESYLTHLERLGLLMSKPILDRKTGQPEYNSSGVLRKKSPEITNLGRYLLKQIGLVNRLYFER